MKTDESSSSGIIMIYGVIYSTAFRGSRNGIESLCARSSAEVKHERRLQ